MAATETRAIKAGNFRYMNQQQKLCHLFVLQKEILDLKGISSTELGSLGGKLYAYTNAKGSGSSTLSKLGGYGGDGSRNNCWASKWQRWFEGQIVKASLGIYLDAADMETYAYSKGTYWSSTPKA